MSDGPHKSLPMRKGWKRVAERGDNHAFAPSEVAAAIIPALEDDCRAEIRPEFLGSFLQLYNTSSLFSNPGDLELRALGAEACTSFERELAEKAIELAAHGHTSPDSAGEAMTRAVMDRAARGARQVEEHYARKSTRPHALRVRTRIEEGIGLARSQLRALAGKLLRGNRGSPLRVRRQQGLDDGVRF